MSSIIRRLLVLVLCLSVLSVGMTASAAEGTIDVTYVKITGENFVADSLHGVDALYNRYGSTYLCIEYITRYYQEVYGLNVQPYGSGPQVIDNEQYWFELAKTPEPGDILFAHASRRSKWYNHWAIVKDYDPATGVMTLIEQNWRWNGQAGINRTMKFPSEVYYCYTLCSTNEIQTLHEQAVEESWAAESIREAEQTGIFTYYGDFNEFINREQFCEMLCNLVTSFNGAPVDETGTPMQFASSSEKAWAMGILPIVDETTIDPEAVLSREEAAALLSRAYALVCEPPQADPDAAVFADADSVSTWAAESVALMASCGILQGNANGCFCPAKSLSVESAITLTMRLLETIRHQLELELLLPTDMTAAYETECLSALAPAAPAMMRAIGPIRMR